MDLNWNILLETPVWTWPLPTGMALAIALWLGACFGSFSNVLIHRLPRNLSVVRPRSFCPGCEKGVVWYDNIPLLSWLLLRGRCRHCGSGISLRYFLVELAGSLCVLMALLRFGWSLEALAASLFLILLLDVAVIDWQHMIIPHTLSVAGMVLGLLFALFNDLGLPGALLGLATGGGIILAVSWGYKLLRGVVGMGGGDVMLMGMVGAFLGAWASLGVLFVGAFLGTLYAVSAGRGRVDGSSKLPFGTFLAAAAALVMFWGPAVAGWYVDSFLSAGSG
jgi:leader peptidase (prepilin peptidase)/N-methyltransferase